MTMALATMLSLSSCLNDLGQTEQNRPEGGEDIVVNEDFEYAEGELFVKFSPEVEAMLGNIGRSGATRSGVPSVDEVLSIVDGYHIERVFPVDSRHEQKRSALVVHRQVQWREGQRGGKEICTPWRGAEGGTQLHHQAHLQR